MTLRCTGWLRCCWLLGVLICGKTVMGVIGWDRWYFDNNCCWLCSFSFNCSLRLCLINDEADVDDERMNVDEELLGKSHSWWIASSGVIRFLGSHLNAQISNENSNLWQFYSLQAATNKINKHRVITTKCLGDSFGSGLTFSTFWVCNAPWNASWVWNLRERWKKLELQINTWQQKRDIEGDN